MLSVEYRLAPEHPYPAAAHDALAYRGFLPTGVTSTRLAFAGESAGGGLALGTLVAAGDAGLSQPSAAVPFLPSAGLTLSGASMEANAAVDVRLTPDGLRRRVSDYTGAADPLTGAVSPSFADLHAIVPLLIQAGSHEGLLDDATRLAATAAADDVAVQLDVTQGAPHIFPSFALLDPRARMAHGQSAWRRSRVRGPRQRNRLVGLSSQAKGGRELGSPGSGDDGSPDALGDWRGRARLKGRKGAT